jgi:hypothetical protein
VLLLRNTADRGTPLEQLRAEAETVTAVLALALAAAVLWALRIKHQRDRLRRQIAEWALHLAAQQQAHMDGTAQRGIDAWNAAMKRGMERRRRETGE